MRCERFNLIENELKYAKLNNMFALFVNLKKKNKNNNTLTLLNSAFYGAAFWKHFLILN